MDKNTRKKLDMDKIAQRLGGKRTGLIVNLNILNPVEESLDIFRRRQEQRQQEEKRKNK